MSMDWNAVDFAFRHAAFHRKNEEGSCCCPANDILCPGCPSHKQAHVDRLAEAERLLTESLTAIDAYLTSAFYDEAHTKAIGLSKDVRNKLRAFLKQEPVKP